MLVRKILVVDDEVPLLDLYQEILSLKGYDVTCINNSPEALKMVTADPSMWSLVISDFTMPDMTGYELAEEIRKHDQQLPIIICSGYPESLDKKEQQRLSIEQCLLKPVDYELLDQAIRQTLK